MKTNHPYVQVVSYRTITPTLPSPLQGEGILLNVLLRLKNKRTDSPIHIPDSLALHNPD